MQAVGVVGIEREYVAIAALRALELPALMMPGGLRKESRHRGPAARRSIVRWLSLFLVHCPAMPCERGETPNLVSEWQSRAS